MKSITIILTVLGLVSCSYDTVKYSVNAMDALNNLDNTIDNIGIYDGFKIERINSLKTRIQNTKDNENLYWILDEIYNEYNKYDLDSTARYASLKQSVAYGCRNEDMIYDAIFDVADMYIMSGMYHEAFELINDVEVAELNNHGLTPRYYHLMNTLYGGFAHSSDDFEIEAEYKKRKAEYRKKLFDCLGENDISKVYIKAEILIDSLKYNDAIVILDQWNSRDDVTTHNKAIINYLLGVSYKGIGDFENALINYTSSAICDLTTPIRDYRSLYELAELLYEKGDFERASKYITRSIKDADAANIHINIDRISSLLPVIYNSYNSSIKHKKRISNIMLAGISLLLILLAVMTSIAFKDKQKLAAKEKELRESNIELRKVNERLQRYINRLKESNEIKETYISRYIDLCSDYIGRLDKYRSELRKISRSGGYEAIQKELRSTEVIDNELAEFYAQFDATFLDLFPDFIPQLNMLLKPDKQIESKDGLLTTELRVCALIRLGVTDSVKISEFLRRSVSTIYNYRVKMRNASVNEREDFENEIMKIGKLP